ncbi:hypothetical protein [Kitasatospora kifunensis]|uniref:Uncharacterized protein n=1 Tax=Kitasatospora kifunensis TaxID=58351 RepID=A0A7W7RAB2_KITKI|nr:hypothetical protein [Kitasatospora kifunensis]MBB4928254.1 hypothetical protein [Kitasatospora kifunensis]
MNRLHVDNRGKELVEAASGQQSPGIWLADHATNEIFVENPERVPRQRSVLSRIAASRRRQPARAKGLR